LLLHRSLWNLLTRPPGKGVVALVLILALGAGRADAGDESRGDEILVADIEPKLVDGQLAVSARCQNLFSRKSISTLQSGLPAVVRVDIDLLEASTVKSLFSSKGGDYESVYATELVKSISYNIWNERYAIRYGEKSAVFSEFDSVSQAVSRIDCSALVETSRLKPMSTYAVRMRVQLIPISAEQGDRIADWLRNPHRLNEELGAEERGGSLQFNVSKLVSVFWGRKKPARDSSAWHISKPFRISDSGELLE